MLLIKNGYVKTMAGPDLPQGSVLIGDDGKILSVAETIDAPGAAVIDAQGRLVTPGCVEAHCHIGLHNEAVGWEGMDYNEMIDPITPHMRAIDGDHLRTCSPQLAHMVTSIRANGRRQ